MAEIATRAKLRLTVVRMVRAPSGITGQGCRASVVSRLTDRAQAAGAGRAGAPQADSITEAHVARKCYSTLLGCARQLRALVSRHSQRVRSAHERRTLRNRDKNPSGSAGLSRRL